MNKPKKICKAATQEQLDALVAMRYDGAIDICGGTEDAPLTLSEKMPKRPRAVGSAYVVAEDHAWIRACDRSTVIAFSSADVVAQDRSFVKAYGSAKVRLLHKARACVKEEASLTAFSESGATVHAKKRRKAKGYSATKLLVRSRGNACVTVLGEAHLRLYQKSRGMVFSSATACLYSEDARILE